MLHWCCKFPPRDPRSSNGRTAAFGAVNRGSNPCRGATIPFELLAPFVDSVASPECGKLDDRGWATARKGAWGVNAHPDAGRATSSRRSALSCLLWPTRGPSCVAPSGIGATQDFHYRTTHASDDPEPWRPPSAIAAPDSISKHPPYVSCCSPIPLVAAIWKTRHVLQRFPNFSR